MHLTRLQISDLRCVRGAELRPCAGLNLLLGGNGAGKTSVLEAIYLLGSGKSFRSGGHEAVIRRGCGSARVFAELEFDARLERVGLERGRSVWNGLHNGQRVSELSELATLVPVVCFSPESHELVSGGAEGRRRFFDWLVFHVEPGFAEAYRRYGRVLRQRNALLKRAPTGEELAPWTAALADAGELLCEFRLRAFPSFSAAMVASLGELLAELGAASVQHRRGWREGQPLLERLRALEARERVVGHTLAGPHRSDWSVAMDGHELREQGSRGQQKLVALASVLVMAGLYLERHAHPPIIVLDDLGSELDTEHQGRALRACARLGAQMWVSATARFPALDAWQGNSRLFHVEQGEVKHDG